MFKNRFLLVLGLISLLSVTLAVVYAPTNAPVLSTKAPAISTDGIQIGSGRSKVRML